jgi:hypothetical protein
MPIEIHSGVPFKSSLYPSNSDSSDSDQIPQPRPRRQRPRLRDRYQHGAESLWWVKLYLLAYRVDHPAGNKFRDMVFMSTAVPSLPRRELIENDGQVEEELEEFLHPGLQHHSIPELMQEIRDILYASYVREKPDDPQYMGKVYRRVFRSLDTLVNVIKTEVKGVKCVKVPMKRDYSEAPSKPRDDDEYKKQEEEEEEEEPSSDPPVPKKRKKARMGNRR